MQHKLMGFLLKDRPQLQNEEIINFKVKKFTGPDLILAAHWTLWAQAKEEIACLTVYEFIKGSG